MKESPVFSKIKAEGKTSKNPLKESFGNKYNFKYVLLALFGAVMGQGVIWYTGQFYAMSFISKVCNVTSQQTDTIMAIALLLATPFFIVFGALSDKIGRKKIMLLGILLAVISYRPIYKAIYNSVDCSQKIEILEKQNTQIEKQFLANTNDSLIITKKQLNYSDGTTQNITIKTTKKLNSTQAATVDEKKSIELNNSNYWLLVVLVFIQVIFVTMVYGPIAAFLVEMFPTKIRYTSMSLPYHIGNGIFGGLLPTVATYLVTNAKNDNISEWYLQGLWYPIIVGSICFIIGLIYLDKNDNKINES